MMALGKLTLAKFMDLSETLVCMPLQPPMLRRAAESCVPGRTWSRVNPGGNHLSQNLAENETTQYHAVNECAGPNSHWTPEELQLK